MRVSYTALGINRPQPRATCTESRIRTWVFEFANRARLTHTNQRCDEVILIILNSWVFLWASILKSYKDTKYWNYYIKKLKYLTKNKIPFFLNVSNHLEQISSQLFCWWFRCCKKTRSVSCDIDFQRWKSPPSEIFLSLNLRRFFPSHMDEQFPYKSQQTLSFQNYPLPRLELLLNVSNTSTDSSISSVYSVSAINCRHVRYRRQKSRFEQWWDTPHKCFI